MSWRNKAWKEALQDLGTGATNRALRFNVAMRLIVRGARVAVTVAAKAVALGRVLGHK